MKPEEAIRDPVFQLNLLVWMAKEQPAQGFRVRPLFHEHGFQLHYIEQPFPFSPEVRNAIETVAESQSWEVNLTPEPELTIQRPDDQTAVYFEAKAQGFTSSSSNVKQARGHLLACGSAFYEAYKPLKAALLDYVVPNGDTEMMNQCLTELRGALAQQSLQPGPFAVNGLSFRDGSLHYHLDKATSALLPTSEPDAIVMSGLAPDTDPSPLLLVYSDEDCPDDKRRGHYRRVLQNQVLANLLCLLNRLPVGQVVEISALEILVQTTIGAFEFLGRQRQKSMMALVSENLFRRVFEYWKDKAPELVTIAAKTLTIHYKDIAQKEQFLGWLEDGKRTGFLDDRAGSAAQLDLLPSE